LNNQNKGTAEKKEKKKITALSIETNNGKASVLNYEGVLGGVEMRTKKKKGER